MPAAPGFLAVELRESEAGRNPASRARAVARSCDRDAGEANAYAQGCWSADFLMVHVHLGGRAVHQSERQAEEERDR